MRPTMVVTLETRDVEKDPHLVSRASDIPTEDHLYSKSNINFIHNSPDTHTLTLIPSSVGHHPDADASATEKPIVLPSDFPEGGLKAWLTVFGAVIGLLCTFGQLNAFGTFQTWYAKNQLQQLSPSTISWIGSIQLWVFFLSGGPIGWMFDLYGPRALMCAGTFCSVFGLMMTSISTKYYQYILAQGVLFGIGTGLILYPALGSISTHFQKYRATTLGIAVAGSSVGGVVWPLLFQALFQKVGFGWGVRIVGFVTLVGCAVAVLCVSRNIKVLQLKREQEMQEKQKVISASTTTVVQGTEPQSQSVLQTFIRTFRDDRRFALFTAGSSLVALGVFIPFFYIIDFTKDLPHPPTSPHTSFVVLAVLNAGGIFGRTAPAYLADTFGRFNLLVPTAFISGVLSLALWIPSRVVGIPLVMVYAAVYGFFAGAFISLVNPCVVQISDIREAGRRMGIFYSVISIPALIGGPIAGALLRAGQGSYTGMILFSAITVIVGSLLNLGAKLMINRRLFARV